MAYKVVGNSMNGLDPKPIVEGDIAICVDWAATGYVPVTGMIVVVEQFRDGGAMRELSLKEVEVHEGRCILRPRSKSSRNREIELDPSGAVTDRTVRIVALAYQIQTSLRGTF